MTNAEREGIPKWIRSNLGRRADPPLVERRTLLAEIVARAFDYSAAVEIGDRESAHGELEALRDLLGRLDPRPDASRAIHASGRAWWLDARNRLRSVAVVEPSAWTSRAEGDDIDVRQRKGA